MTKEERREYDRMGLGLPVQVRGHDHDGNAWTEMTTGRDASPGGVSFGLSHVVKVGQVLALSLPLPKRFRRYDIGETSYSTYALVRDVAATAGSSLRVGVQFRGKQRPPGYNENPGRLYRLPTDTRPAAEEPLHIELFLSFRIRREAEPSSQETTIAETVSKRGARLLTSLPIRRGDILILEELEGRFKTRAEVQSVEIGSDNVPRLNLTFLDAEAPDLLISDS